jgi:predicted homoserine dehydrogenase-like protein
MDTTPAIRTAAAEGVSNTIDLAATPEACIAEAASKGMNPKMLAAFKDGTKTMMLNYSVNWARRP